MTCLYYVGTMPKVKPNLSSKVCLVTGASCGIGRGIALQLALNCARCYITGRHQDTLQKVADEAQARNAAGIIIPVQCDHSKDEEVTKLFERISFENNGRLHLLVNNAYAAVEYLFKNSKLPFWDQDPFETWDIVNNVGLRNHYICSVFASRLMVPHNSGLIVQIGSIGGLTYSTTPAYGIGKAAVDRVAKDCAIELKKYNIASVSLWPSATQTEKMLAEVERMTDVKEDNYEVVDHIVKHGETTEFSGICVSHLLAGALSCVEYNDFVTCTPNMRNLREQWSLTWVLRHPDPKVMRFTGKTLLSTELARKYNFKDINGRVPPSLRSFKFMAGASRNFGLSRRLPNWLQMPWGMFKSVLASSFGEDTKQPSKYANKKIVA